MFLVVVNTPDDGRREYGPFSTVQEAQWRADYEHRCAEYLYGCDARADIGTRIEAFIAPRQRRRPSRRRRWGHEVSEIA